MKIWIIEETGDDYHGSRVLNDAYTSREAAQSGADGLMNQQKACSDCGHKYLYTVTEITVYFHGNEETK